MKIFKTIMLSIAATFALTSCDSENEQTVQYVYDYNVSYVTDMNANTTLGTQFDGAKYVMDFDLTEGTVNVSIFGLRLNPTSSPIQLKIENATYKFVNGATVINVPNATSTFGETHSISNFKFSQTMKEIEKMGQIEVYYAISYTVDNRYNVVAVQEEAFLPGSTVVTNNATGEIAYSSSEPYYNYDLDDDNGTAEISAYFLSDGEKKFLDLEFDNLPYRLTPYGIEINVEGSFTAEQPSSMSGTPFVAKAIYMNSRYDGTTEIRILTEDKSFTANLSYASNVAPLN